MHIMYSIDRHRSEVCCTLFCSAAPPILIRKSVKSDYRATGPWADNLAVPCIYSISFYFES